MIVIVLPDIPEEDQLLARARRGDDDAIRSIYQQYFPPIYQFIRMRVDQVDTAEDIASEVFLKLVAALRSRNAPHHSLRGWLFRVARNVLHDHYGKERQFTVTTLEEWIPAPLEGDPELQFMRTLDSERARSAIRELSTDQQEVIILRFGQALSLQETADIMGRNANAIKQLQFRAVNTLRRILQDERKESGHV
jgi:RNA polymerase sigma-70 factor (ECF subfamily)